MLYKCQWHYIWILLTWLLQTHPQTIAPKTVGPAKLKSTSTLLWKYSCLNSDFIFPLFLLQLSHKLWYLSYKKKFKINYHNFLNLENIWVLSISYYAVCIRHKSFKFRPFVGLKKSSAEKLKPKTQLAHLMHQNPSTVLRKVLRKIISSTAFRNITLTEIST